MQDTRRTFGYARISTDDQDLTLQYNALIRYGVNPDHIVEERKSGGSMNRPGWNRVMKVIRPGDTVVVWKLDRLGRTLAGVIDTVAEMGKLNVALVSLTETIDTRSAMGRAFFQIALVFAELERALISERTKAGIAARRAQGVRFGAKHSIAENPKRIEAYRQLVAEGRDLEMTAQEITDALIAADPKAKKIHVNTFRNWRKAGFPGLTE